MAKKMVAGSLALLLMLIAAFPGFAEGERDGSSAPEYYVPDVEHLIAAGISDEADTSEIEGRTAFAFSENGVSAEWSLTVPKRGRYIFGFDYFPLEGKKLDIVFSLSVDGGELEVSLPRLFKDREEISKDGQGNELSPRQEEVFEWQKGYGRTGGRFDDGMTYFELEPGEHTLRLTAGDEPFAVSGVSVCESKKVEDYAAYKEALPDSPGSGLIVVEAEKASFKTNAFLRPASDRSSPLTTPYDPNLIRMNILGGASWKTPGQSVTWDFEVKSAGLYNIGVRYRQNFVRGFFTTRVMRIDGEVLFDRMGSVRFPYNGGFDMMVLGGDEPCPVYLEAGKHTINLEASAGEMSGLLKRVDGTLLELSAFYRKIVGITGVKPDLYRDYELHRTLPQFEETLSKCVGEFNSVYKDIEALSGQSGSEAAVIMRLSEQLESFIREPETVPERLERFKVNISSLQTWLLSVSEQPLEIDKIYFVPRGDEMPNAKAGFFAQAVHEIRAFIGSFFIDYDSFGVNGEAQKSISVWIGSGRDQASVLKRLTDESFTKQYGAAVKISLVQGALLQAVMAGEGPDVALGVGRGDPVNMGIRGSLLDIAKQPDIGEVAERFKENALLPYRQGDKLYGLPETQAFHVMFYRKDILAELGLEPPDTWQKLFSITPVIQSKNMEIGLPYAQMDAYATVGAGMGSSNLFPALLMQNRGRIYNSDLSATDLESPAAFKAFKMWLDFYTQYGFVLIKDDFSRFRTGEMPIVITNYPFFNQLTVAAPEIKGLWDMTTVPGTADSDGSINISESASGSAAVIISNTKEPELCYDFLKWWTSAETQAEFGTQIEMILGAAGRYNSANVEAFKRLAWSGEQQRIIEKQWDSVVEIEELPGSYYTSRNIDNAFKAVIFRNENFREALTKWNRETNLEIERKRAEFGIKN